MQTFRISSGEKDLLRQIERHTGINPTDQIRGLLEPYWNEWARKFSREKRDPPPADD